MHIVQQTRMRIKIFLQLVYLPTFLIFLVADFQPPKRAGSIEKKRSWSMLLHFFFFEPRQSVGHVRDV